jgi:hypothetical protein
MEATSIRVVPEPVRSLAFGSISGTYAAVGTPLANPARIIMFQNFTNGDAMISFDGVNDHLPVAANGFVLLDVTANKVGAIQGFFIAKNTTFYLRQIVAPTSGSFYITAFYGFSGAY